jgi:ribosomal protein S18 acetylase RimI-like enzyme
MNIQLRLATLEDCDRLAEMNQQLIIDEGSRNPMGIPELSERIRRWLVEDWQAVLILTGKAVVGYALFRIHHDEYHPEQSEVYVRQYFIKPLFRGRGIGQAAFEQLQAAYFPPDAALVVDVLATNPRARHFWEKIGFRAYAENLRLEKRRS